MIDFVLSFEFNGLLGIFLYWVPLSLCLYGYTVRTWTNYRKDVANREEAGRKEHGYYYPTDTVGTIIGRAFATFTPLANIWVATFDVAPEVFERLGKFICRVFDQPLVPERKR